SPRQPSGKNIIRWLLKKRTNGSVRYCQYTSDITTSSHNHLILEIVQSTHWKEDYRSKKSIRHFNFSFLTLLSQIINMLSVFLIP
ncbi:hypothetical protein, partial [Escherichia coli]